MSHYRFIAALAAFSFSTATAQTPSATNPSPGELLARHEAALGGRPALDKHSSIRLLGTVQVDNGSLKGTVEILRAKPNKFVQKITLSSVGELWKGFDGTTAWVIELSIPAILTDADAASLKSHSQWDHNYLAAVALHVGQVDTTQFEGQAAWRVTYAAELGLEMHTFFSRESGLRIGNVSNSMAGPTTTVFGDYTEFGGIKIPARLVTRSDAGEMTVTIDKVEFDKVEASAFSLPPAIKAIARTPEPQ